MQCLDIMPGVRLSNDRCLILDDSTMIISDLHLGYESSLESEGVHLPRINTLGIRESLHRCLDRHEPDTVVILGDVKHDFRRPDGECRRDIMSILELIAETARPLLVRGNHDNYLQNVIAGSRFEMHDSLDIAGFRLEHGHEDSGVRPVVIGHEHPSLRIRDATGASVKLPCFLWSERAGVIVIPSFSRFSGGNDIGLSGGGFMSPALAEVGSEELEVCALSEIGLLPLGSLDPLLFRQT